MRKSNKSSREEAIVIDADPLEPLGRQAVVPEDAAALVVVSDLLVGKHDSARVCNPIEKVPDRGCPRYMRRPCNHRRLYGVFVQNPA